MVQSLQGEGKIGEAFTEVMSLVEKNPQVKTGSYM